VVHAVEQLLSKKEDLNSKPSPTKNIFLQRHFKHTYLESIYKMTECQYLTPIILSTWETEMRRKGDPCHPGQKEEHISKNVHKPNQTKTKGLEVLSGKAPSK
jgi:hypothetical protein